MKQHTSPPPLITAHQRAPYTLWREMLVLVTYSLFCAVLGVMLGWKIATWRSAQPRHHFDLMEKMVPVWCDKQ